MKKTVSQAVAAATKRAVHVTARAAPKAGRAAGAMVGSAMGGSAGAAAGASAGGTAGSYVKRRLKRILGNGDYTMGPEPRHNSLIGAMSKGASFSDMDGSGVIRIQHREFIGNLFSGAPGAFANSVYPINPGLPGTFPFLAQIAQNYTQYRWEGLVVELVSTTSPFGSSNPALGANVIVASYNPSLPAYTNMAAAVNSDYAVSGRIDESLAYGIECAPGMTSAQWYYTRGTGLAGGSTPVNLTDMVLLQVITQPGTAIPENTNMGQLFITYDVSFKDPRISPNRSGMAHYLTDQANAYAFGVDLPTVIFEPNGSLQGTTVTRSTQGEFPSLRWTFPDANPGDVYMFNFSTPNGQEGFSPGTSLDYTVSGLQLSGMETFPYFSTLPLTTPQFSTLPLGFLPETDEKTTVPGFAWSLVFVVSAEQPVPRYVDYRIVRDDGQHPGSFLGYTIQILNLGNGWVSGTI